MVKWAAMHGLWWALNTLSSALWNATTLFTVTGIAVKMHWNDRCYFSYKHLKKCHNPLILQFKINPAMQKLQIGLSHTKKKTMKEFWSNAPDSALAPARPVSGRFTQSGSSNILTDLTYFGTGAVTWRSHIWWALTMLSSVLWNALLTVTGILWNFMCKNALKRQKTFQLKTDEKVPQSINTTVQDQSCCAEVLQISLSHKQWASEYLLNGTSAQYRLFSAINGRTLEWFILKAMNTT